VLKFLLKKSLVYRTPPYTSLWEKENEDIQEDDGNPDWVDEVSDVDDIGKDVGMYISA
jgi:hypothetical protein